MKSLSEKYNINYLFLIVVAAAFILRFVNLGYSDYQGDEIKAMFQPAPGQSISDFLLDQRKGPMQFIITGLIRFIDPDYSNEFLLRLPFALAGFFSVILFYKLVRKNFGEKVAFYAGFFFATNGFLVALSRIVQYQSFVILFMVLALYLMTLKKYFWGFVFWALSILSHYDGVFIAPFALYLVYPDLKKKEVLSGIAVFIILLALFYVPFVFSISDATKSYWQGRLEGTGGKISSSRYLFSVYQPIYVLHIYTILAALGIIHIATRVISAIKSNTIKDSVKYIFLLIWVLVPFTFLEAIVNIPGTHIFTYLVPLTIVLGLGISLIERLFEIGHYIPEKLEKASLAVGMLIVFAFIFAQSYVIYVDHTYEYPWEYEKFFVFTLFKPTPIYHLSLFGFPYYRHWEEIADFVRTAPHNGYYSTNERDSISRHYVKLNKGSDQASLYVYIVNPQSYTDKVTNDRIVELMSKNTPIKIFYDSLGREISKIYKFQP